MQNRQQTISIITRMRICAAIIDYSCFLILLIIFFIVFGKPTSAFSYEVEGNIAYVPFYIWVFYFVIYEWINQGTLGKQILGLRVSSISKKRVTLSQIILRRLCDSFDIWLTCGLLALGKSMMNHFGRRIADEVAGTIVERR